MAEVVLEFGTAVPGADSRLRPGGYAVILRNGAVGVVSAPVGLVLPGGGQVLVIRRQGEGSTEEKNGTAPGLSRVRTRSFSCYPTGFREAIRIAEVPDMGGGIPVSQMTNRQLIIAMPLVCVVSVANMCLFAGAFALEWSGGRRLSELLGSALAIVFFAVFLAYLETAFIRELRKRRRAN